MDISTQNIYNLSDIGMRTNLIDSGVFSEIYEIECSNRVLYRHVAGRFHGMQIENNISKNYMKRVVITLREEVLLKGNGV